MKFGENLPHLFFEISKSQKSELGTFIPDFPLKHVITSTNRFEFIQYLNSDIHGLNL